ncbi:DDE_3 domain-containing protein [Trichonephila clavipes]|uniref:DDE_3 domain-containing protein n=1 Tax=Trichonephila clavipes TaxID=2585209 RepID=A0A8X6RCS8_TRICX|nr:DDE_3 domain-containing protein [Trichonephila clavipes]
MGHVRQYCAKTIIVKARRSSSNGGQIRTNGQEGSTVYLVGLERNNLLSVASAWLNTKFRYLLSTIGPIESYRVTINGQNWPTEHLLCSIRTTPGPFLNGLPGAIFQQNNARPHTERVAEDFLCPFKILPWPARSPDLSPVEHA